MQALRPRCTPRSSSRSSAADPATLPWTGVRCTQWQVRRCGSGSSHRLRASAEDEAPPVLGDWREFRARLVSTQSAEPSTARQSQGNLRLLEIQNPRLAAEGVWAHATVAPERGGLLLATVEGPELLRNDRLTQVVVLLVEHSERGSLGLILNRPTGMVLGIKSAARRDGLPFPVENAHDSLQEVFGSSRVYCGGYTAQQVIHILHGHALPATLEVVPGVYLGGDAGAIEGVRDARLSAGDFKFFSGAMVWEPGELQDQVNRGAWYTAACSRSIVLKQCLQLPVPLWREVLLLMGGKHAEVGGWSDDGSDGDE